MKFYDIDVLAQKYGGGNKYVATSMVAESACRLSEKKKPDDNDPEKEKYLSEVLAQFERGVDVATILREEVPDKDKGNESSPEGVSAVGEGEVEAEAEVEVEKTSVAFEDAFAVKAGDE